MNTKLLACLWTLVALSLTNVRLGGAQNDAGVPATSKVKRADEIYKNIQILKDIPADQVLPAMQFITYSLGVECSFCHVEGAFEKDEKKPKQTARKMMQMMFTINQVNFQGRREVTCYTCHRGSSRPLATPTIPVATEGFAEGLQPGDEDRPVPPGVPSPDQIFAAFADAVGGAPAIAKLSTRIEKGTISLGGKQLAIEIFSKDPGRRVTVIHLADGDSISACDATGGWTHAPGRPVRDVPAAEFASARIETDLKLPVRFKQSLTNLTAGRPQKVGEHDVYVVNGLSDRQSAVKLYFDQHSGLLIRMVRFVDSPLGLNPTQIDYADYRAQGGVKMAFQRTVARPGSRFMIQIEEARDNVPIDDGKFVRPPDQFLNEPPVEPAPRSRPSP